MAVVNCDSRTRRQPRKNANSLELLLQVDDGSWAHMVHAYVHLQEGNIVEGEQNITNAMKAALIRCAECVKGHRSSPVAVVQDLTVIFWQLLSRGSA